MATKPKPGSWEWWNSGLDTEPTSKPETEIEVFVGKLLDDDSGYVYYCGDGNGRVKIGWSKNPWSRVSEQRTWNPNVKLLAVERGGMRLEKQRHYQFKDDHLALEWFRKTKALKQHIESLTEKPTRKAYMKEYMAKRRALKRGDKVETVTKLYCVGTEGCKTSAEVHERR